jgi:zinc protease
LAAALYPPDDPARRTASPATVNEIALDDVKSYYAEAYRPDLTTIVVVGDVTPEHAREAIERAFGAWSAKGPIPNVFPPAVAPNRAAEAAISAAGRLQAQVTLSEVIPIGNTDPDYPMLRLANTVLSGEFYASILYRDLREVHGYAYDVSSAIDAGRNRSVFSISYGSDPENVARASRLVVDDLTALQKAPLPREQLLRAQALVLGQLPIQRESYSALAWQLLAFSSAGQPLDEDVIEARAALSATPQRVQNAVAKWIRPQDLVRIVIGPEGR